MRNRLPSSLASHVPGRQGDKDLAQADAFGAALHGNVALRPQMTPLLQAGPAAELAGAGAFHHHTPAGVLTGSLIITGQCTGSRGPCTASLAVALS